MPSFQELLSRSIVQNLGLSDLIAQRQREAEQYGETLRGISDLQAKSIVDQGMYKAEEIRKQKEKDAELRRGIGSTVGAAAGFYFGGPQGASIGAKVGGDVGEKGPVRAASDNAGYIAGQAFENQLRSEKMAREDAKLNKQYAREDKRDAMNLYSSLAKEDIYPINQQPLSNQYQQVPYMQKMAPSNESPDFTLDVFGKNQGFKKRLIKPMSDYEKEQIAIKNRELEQKNSGNDLELQKSQAQINLINQQIKTSKANEVKTYADANKVKTSAKNDKNAYSFGTAKLALDNLEKLAPKISSTGFKPLNYVSNKIAEVSGGTAIDEYEQNNSILAKMMASAIENGRISDQDYKIYKDNIGISSDLTYKQKMNRIKNLRAVLTNADKTSPGTYKNWNDSQQISGVYDPASRKIKRY